MPPLDGAPPPHDLRVEAEVLSAVLLDPSALAKVEGLQMEHFYSEANRRIFEACRDLRASGSPVDLVTVRDWLDTHGRLAQVGGAGYIAEVANASPVVANVATHAGIVVRKANDRALISELDRASADLRFGKGDAEDTARRMRAHVDRYVRTDSIVTLGAHELAEQLPPQAYLIRALGIGPGAPTCVAGYGFSAKTMALQSLMLDVATGANAWGVYQCRAGRALHLDYEQGRRLDVERYQRQARARGIDLRDLADGDRLRLAVHPSVYLTAPNAEDVFTRAAAGFDLVVVDSLKAATAGADENSSEIRQYVDVLARVSERTGATIVIVHHARKPKADDPKGARYTMRGSSALFDAMASVFVFAGAKGEPTRVHHEKCRNRGVTVEDFGLQVEDVEIDGDPRGGLRMVHLEPEQLEGRAASVESPSRNVDRVRAYLVQAGRHLGSKDALRERVGMGQGPFRAALSVLQSTGEAIIETGKPGMSIVLRTTEST